MEAPMTKTEFNYISTIQTLTALDEKKTEKLNEKDKIIADKDLQLNSINDKVKTLTIENANLSKTNQQLRNEMSSLRLILNEEKKGSRELRLIQEKLHRAEREFNNTIRKQDNIIELKNNTIRKLERELKEMYEEMSFLHNEVKQLEEGGNIPSEVVEATDKLMTNMKKSGAEELSKSQATNTTDTSVEKSTEPDSDLNAVIDLIKKEIEKGNGRIHEDLLASYKEVTFDKSKITITARIGGLIMRRNYLSPTFSIQNS